MISIILPCYNEEKSIESNVSKIKEEIIKTNKEYEIIVVDDGSTDGSREKLKSLDIKIISHPHNLGYGAALKTGIQNAKFDTIVISDIDGSYPPKHIPELIKVYEDSFNLGNGLDMVVGARKGKEYDGSLAKFIFRKLLKFLVEWTTGRTIVDINSGMRVFSKKTVLNFLQQLCNTFSFTTSLTLAYMLNAKFVKYESIEYDARQGNSHVRIFRDSLRTLQYIVEAIIYYNPLKLFLLFFLFFMIISIVFLIVSIYTKSILFMMIMGSSLIVAFISLFFGFLLDLIRQNSKKK